MANPEITLLVKMKDEASKELGKLQKNVGLTSKQMRNMGIGMMAAGGAIVAGMGMAVKAANAERIGISRLEAQLKNVGVSYDDVKGSLEDVISATQYKTGIADDEQRIALGELVMITGDYQRSLDLMPLALDLAAAKEMDLGTAAEVVGRVAVGNTTILKRYGIELKEGATAAEALAEMQSKVGGTAEATRDPMKVLGAQIGDLKEAIGTALLPVVTKWLDKLTLIIKNVQIWAEANPTLIKTIAAVGVALIGAGGLLIALSQISKAVISINAALVVLRALSGPTGWAMLAAGMAIAAGTIVGMKKLIGGATVPTMQHGGIVTRPTFGLMGEAGPEAIVPLSRMRGGVTWTGDIIVQGSVIAERDLAETVREQLFLIKNRNYSTGIA